MITLASSKIKTFLQKYPIFKKPWNVRKYFQIAYLLICGVSLILMIHNSYNSEDKNPSLMNGQKIWIDISLKTIAEMIGPVQRCSTLLAKYELKPQARYYYTPVYMFNPQLCPILCEPWWLAACQALCPSLSFRVCSKSCPLRVSDAIQPSLKFSVTPLFFLPPF